MIRLLALVCREICVFESLTLLNMVSTNQQVYYLHKLRHISYVQSAGQTVSRCQVLENIEHFVFAFFVAEMVIKMVAMGVIGKKGYLQDKWNRLDCFIVVIG